MRVLRHNPLAMAGAVLIVILLCCALFSPLIARQDPAYLDLPSRLSPPSHAHWFGTDELGRDIFARVVYGTRISMLGRGSVVAESLLFGVRFRWPGGH